MRRPVSGAGCGTLPDIGALDVHWEGRAAVKKDSITVSNRKRVLEARKLTIRMDLGDRSSHYCVLDDQGDVIVEGRVATTKKGMTQVFGAMPRSRVAIETGTHSPWVSRQLSELGHEVIVANARNVGLIGESTRKDDQWDAKTSGFLLVSLSKVPREEKPPTPQPPCTSALPIKAND